MVLKTNQQIEIIVYKIIDDEILFLLLKRNKQKGGFWQPVSGGVHEGESLLQALKRELKEETGISKYLNLISDIYYFEFKVDNAKVLREYVFGVEISPKTKIKISKEHTAMKWLNLKNSLKILKHKDNKTGFKKLYSMLKTQ